MCIFLYNFSFSLHYKCNYGEFLVLVGSSEQLGLWDVSKGIELQWMEVSTILYFSLKYKTPLGEQLAKIPLLQTKQRCHYTIQIRSLQEGRWGRSGRSLGRGLQ